MYAALFFETSAYAQQSPQELLNQATAAQQAGNLDQAAKLYQAIVAKYPNIPEIRSNFGAVLAGMGRYSDAVAQYKISLKLKPNPLVQLNMGLAYYKDNELESAIRALKQAHSDVPANAQATTLLADCYLRVGRNKYVIELLTPLWEGNSTDLGIAYMLGTALIRDGKIPQGERAIDPILKNGDSAEARILMGQTKLISNDFAGAVVDLKKAVELNPNLPDVYSYYGSALLSTGDPANARAAFEKELTLDPTNFEANLRMGVLLRQDEDNAGALKYFERALKVRPGDIGVRYQMAATELAMGQVEKAQKELEVMLKEAPNFTEAHVTLATAYYREKRKADGDRERALVSKLNAEKQAAEPAQQVSK